VAGAATRLAARLGRGPTPDEIGLELGLTVEEVVEARTVDQALRPQSLDALAAQWAGEPSERLGGEDPAYDLIERRTAIDDAWRSLDRRERECLRLRFVEDLTYAGIAGSLGLSVSHAARLTNRALERLQAVAAAGR
jgi:RNA polymerase sigma-B factor